MESTSESFFVLFIITLCGLLFIATWLGILFLVAHLGGWSKLYKSYKFPNRIGNPFLVKSFQSIQLGMSNYNGIMTLSFYPRRAGNGSYDFFSLIDIAQIRTIEIEDSFENIRKC